MTEIKTLIKSINDDVQMKKTKYSCQFQNLYKLAIHPKNQMQPQTYEICSEEIKVGRGAIMPPDNSGAQFHWLETQNMVDLQCLNVCF